MSGSKVDRRRILEYLGAGAIAAGVMAAAYYLRNTPVGREPEVTVPAVTEAPTTVDYPPYADFKWKPYYLNPTDQQTIQFTNTSYDLGGDPLTNTWLIDNKEVSHERDYSTKLPVGEHVVDLQVSDRKQTRVNSTTITVEPDEIYTAIPLHLKHKGISYFAGPVPPDWAGAPNPDRDEMDEQLDTIRNELGCNAVIISAGGDYEDRLIECGHVAIEKGFQRIHIQPRYMGASPDETVERIGKFAPKVRELRQVSGAVVYSLGHEFGLETAIIRGDSWLERLENFMKQNQNDMERIRTTLRKMFKDILAICRKNYGYTLSYAAIAYPEADVVPWEDSAFESVGVDAILEEGLGNAETWVLNLFSHLKKYDKPIQSMEAGCMTFTGAGRVAGTAPLHTQESLQYDEDEQANWIKRYCDLLNRARIDGYFYTQYNDNWDKGYGLYNGKKRKKGFYMYKSYQRVA
jgi:hypothetical protein